ncbi:hypothetical protein B296_00049225 [Ensete ventricosum]|uniref:Uncharacterized protein n=1 Tax=Ensete ventricosum TaxID=4639 RepID=A0A426X4X1_ENSVE|nr:hypothetical protein B296_00049225 [Ensete ventricosum]
MESVDAAIGDVLAQPWLPLPLGLKSPSMDSVALGLRGVYRRNRRCWMPTSPRVGASKPNPSCHLLSLTRLYLAAGSEDGRLPAGREPAAT